MSEVSENLATVQARISAACASGRTTTGAVELIAVSKTFSGGCSSGRLRWRVSLISAKASFRRPNPKSRHCPASCTGISSEGSSATKCRKLLQNFDVIHAIDSLRLASYANEVARELGLFPQVFLQVNIGSELSKGGFESRACYARKWNRLLKLDRLEILGLMCIPPNGPDAEASRTWFVALRELRDALEARVWRESALAQHGDEW